MTESGFTRIFGEVLDTDQLSDRYGAWLIENGFQGDEPADELLRAYRLTDAHRAWLERFVREFAMVQEGEDRSLPPPLVRCELETRNFAFEAFGRTEAEAKSKMERGLAKHCQQFEIGFAQFREDYPEELYVLREVRAGEFYRDREALNV